MSITIDINPELEKQIKQAAAQAGLSLNEFVLQSVKQRLPASKTHRRGAVHLSPQESELLQQINGSLSSVDWERYHQLVEKRRAESLTAEEHVELIDLSDRIEEANARRIEYVAELAKLRNTTLPAMMNELGLHPR